MHVTLAKKYTAKFAFLLRLLAPSIGPIGGLEISDTHVRFFDVRRGKIFTVGLRMPPGIIHAGKVVDLVKLLQVLVEVKKQLGLGERKKINIIVALPPEIAYLQSFTLPYLTGKNLEDAVRLNLEVISPIPFAETHSDWRVIGETADNQLEIMGIFAEKKNVTTMIDACAAAGFVVVAAEPAIFSLARTVHEIGKKDLSEPNIILRASEAGMDFACVNKNLVTFSYFVSWHSIYGDAEETSKKVFEENVVQHVGRVLAFLSGHGSGNMKQLLLITSMLKESFRDIIQENFKLEVKDISLGEFDNFGADWAVAIGAYVRGLLPRGEDTLVSLTGLSTKKEFTQYQIISFFTLWRNIVGAVLLFLVIAFGGTHFFIRNLLNNLPAQTGPALRNEDTIALKTLQASALEFNTLQDEIKSLEAGKLKPSSDFRKILEVASGRVSIKRIYFQSIDAPVLISGTAASESAVVSFKNILLGRSEFSGVDLPLSSIQPDGDHVSFSMTLLFKSLKTE
jgi:hypothetical protein